MFNYKLNAGRGFHPRRCGSPNAITPEQVLRYHSLNAGAEWGDRLISSPSFIPASWISYQWKRNSTEPKNSVMTLKDASAFASSPFAVATPKIRQN